MTRINPSRGVAMRVFSAFIALSLVSLPTAAGASPEPQDQVVPDASASPQAWVDGGSAGIRILDLSAQAAMSLALGVETTLPLDVPLSFRGSLYDTLLVGPGLGQARLAWRGELGMAPFTEPNASWSTPVASPELVLEPLGRALIPLPGASIQVRRAGGITALRWTSLADPWGGPAAFEIVLSPPSGLAFQYFQVPLSIRSAPETAAVLVESTDGDPSHRTAPSAQGFRPATGGVIVFPGDEGWNPHTGCATATPWCNVVRAWDAGCITSSGHNDETSCTTTDAQLWHFNEGQYCRSCPYTFYVTVECGQEMHLPFRDMEGNQISITDVFTGVQLQLEGINDCAKVPFRYCDRCATGTGGITLAPPAGCGAIPTRDCIPYLQRSTLIQWGFPRQDLNGDTVADELPCGPPNQAQCGGSGAYAGHEEQNTDVILHGSPALCGVFRLDIVAGGYHWYLAANCTGIVPDPGDPASIAQNYHIYQNCGDALRAFDPVPELVITDLTFSGVCPDIMVTVEVTNIGCVDSPSSPVHLDFSQGSQTDLDLDMGVVAAGTAVSRTIPVTLRNTPQTVTATVDPLNIIAECTEQPQGSFSGCEPASGADSLAKVLCSCVNTVQAAVTDMRFFSCDRNPAIIDGSGSTAVPCAGGQVEYLFLDEFGAIVRDWSTDPTLSVVPARCPSREVYSMQVRCSLEPGADCIAMIDGIEVECAEGRTIEVIAAPTEICEGEIVTVTASSGFLTYAWTNGRTGRVIQDRPTASTNYQVTGTDLYGCTATASVAITVLPDPLPGPIGNYLRCTKENDDVVFTYRELTQLVGTYELILHVADGTRTPCTALAPVEKPWPAIMQVAGSADSALVGDPMPALRHVGGVSACPKLLFYEILATSPCTFRRGPACDGFPQQLPPCP